MRFTDFVFAFIFLFIICIFGMFIWRHVRTWFLNMRQSIGMLSYQIEGFDSNNLPVVDLSDQPMTGADKTNLLVDLIVQVNKNQDILLSADPSYNAEKYEMIKNTDTDPENTYIIFTNIQKLMSGIIPTQDSKIQKIYDLYVGNPDIKDFAGYVDTITPSSYEGDDKNLLEIRLLKMLETIVKGHQQTLDKYQKKTTDDITSSADAGGLMAGIV